LTISLINVVSKLKGNFYNEDLNVNSVPLILDPNSVPTIYLT